MNRQVIAGLFFLILLLAGSSVYYCLSLPKVDRLLFLSVGQGDSMLFESVNGERVLIDGGPDNSAEKRLESYVPWWDRRLDAVVITHGHADHIGGLKEIVNSFNVKYFYLDKDIEISPSLMSLLDLAHKKQTHIVLLNTDYQLNFSSGANLKLILDPEQRTSNERSIVSVLSEGDIKAVFMADVGSEEELRLIEKLKDFRPELIKVGHHGSDFGTSEQLLDKWRPAEAIISVGRNNRFGHPSNRVLKRLERAEVSIERTDEDGDVVYEFKNGHWELAY